MRALVRGALLVALAAGLATIGGVSACASDEAPRRTKAPEFPDIVYERGSTSGSGGEGPGSEGPGTAGTSEDEPRSPTTVDPGRPGDEAPPDDADLGPGPSRARRATSPDPSSARPLGKRARGGPRVLTGAVPAAQRMRVHALDVGQGSATLFELPCAAILVDTGGELNESFDGPAALLEELTRFFARRTDLHDTLALLVITHPHIDHVRGLPALLSRFDVSNVVDNGSDGDELVADSIAVLRSYLRERAGRVGYRAVRTDDVPRGGLVDGVVDPVACGEVDPEIRVLAGRAHRDPGWGQDFYGHRRFENENNHSVVVRVDFGDASVLITGDLEETAIEQLVERTDSTGALDTDLYVVGHHGSHNGTTRELLEEVTPDFAVISMGPADRKHDWTAWRYGHPRAGIVRLLDDMVSAKRESVSVPVARYGRRFDPYQLESAVYATGWDGTVVFEASARGGFRVIETGRDDGRKKTAARAGRR